MRRVRLTTAVFCSILLGCAAIDRGEAGTVATDGDLRIEVITAYNLVVDSNVESPSTYAPRAATLGAKFHNDGANTLTNVYAHIGNYIDGVSDTPGVYPSRPHPPLVGPLAGNAFALWHEGGTLGTSDATRYVGTIAPGESKTVYWLIGYPNLDENGDAVWGPSVKPGDDLWLEYDIWATAMDGATALNAELTRRVTMRNEISAMANKIFPNTANKVPQKYQDLLQKFQPDWTTEAEDGSPGTSITAEGIWYDLGNVGFGFDNDGDLVPDQNAWMQPIGDASLFDPASFRLVRTRAMVVVKLKGGGEKVITATDKLYFENIPDNNGAVGWVGYEFLPLRGPTTSQLTPYQEVASGYDNEKFNGDYGATFGAPIESLSATVNVEKGADVTTALAGSRINYSIEYDNSGSKAAGKPDQGVPLVVTDSIPTGTTYVAGSATVSNALPVGVSDYTVLFSTNNGLSWVGTEPVPASDTTDVQWWLSDELAVNATGTIRLAVTVDNPYLPPVPKICNTARVGFGEGPPATNDSVCVRVLGTNTLGDTIFSDTGSGDDFGNGTKDAGETGLANITIRLYYDENSNGMADVSELLIATTESDAGGGYLFTNLADGSYVAVVDRTDPDLPAGYTLTTDASVAAGLDTPRTNNNAVSYLDADFGFAPALTLDKQLVDASPVREGQQISYTIDVVNRLYGNGSGVGTSTYTVWADTYDTANSSTGSKAWTNPSNAVGASGPDGLYASDGLENANGLLAVTGFGLIQQPGTITNVKLVADMRITGTFVGGDELGVKVIERLTPANELVSIVYDATTLTTGELVIDITNSNSWQWAHFNTNTYSILFVADKGGGPDSGQVEIDGAAFRVLSDESSGGGSASTTLQPAPLTDTYDATQLQFVSAVPAETSSGVSGSDGTVYWSNVGPIYPGGTSSLTVVFNVLEPAGNVSGIITNTAIVTNATFQNGWPANTATDEVTTAVLPAGTIGDRVWRDLDANGVQGGGDETGIAGVTVRLTPPAGVDLGAGAGNPITTTTDREGLYRFDGLPASGSYTVTVVTGSLPGGSGTNTYDEDDGTTSPDNETVVVLDHDATDGSDTYLTADFGYQVQTTIDGLIWNDLNQGSTATRDTGEPWLTNVTVRLLDGGGATVDTTQSDTDGYFLFTGAYSGTYTVVVDTATGPLAVGTWTQSYDSDGVGTSDNAGTSVVSGGSAHVDFSYYQTGAYSIGDTLFYDLNGDATQDSEDEGIPNVTMALYYDAAGNGIVDPGSDTLMATDVTDTDGKYLFGGLVAGNYIVVVDEQDPQFPDNVTPTLDPDEIGLATNGDGRATVVVTTASRLDIDFGYQPTGSGSIGDTVWRDLNGDGTQAGITETGIPSVTVTLYADFNGDTAYVAVTTAVTDASGEYLFSSLPDAAYRVDVSAADPDLPTDAFGSAYVPTTPTTVSVTVSGGNSYLDADFGFAALGAIGDTIFWDSNGSGSQDWNEPGISNVTVELYVDVDVDGFYTPGTDTLVTTGMTDTSGNYLFTDLSATNYVVVVNTNSTPLADAILMADPDADGVPCPDVPTNYPAGCDGETDVTLAVGQNYTGADFGFLPPGIIGGTVWFDLNTNGLRDATEIGIPYVTVELRTNGVTVATTETDPDGYYLFENLTDDTYTVVVLTNDTDFPAQVAQVYDPDGTLDDAATVVISNQHVVSIGGVSCTNCDTAIDFGYRYDGDNLLSGTVGLDGPENDGVMGNTGSGVNANEAPFAGKTVYAYLWNDDGDNTVETGETILIASTTTAANGDYSFSGLPDGDGDDRYIAALSAPADHLLLTTTLASPTPAVVLVQTTNTSGEVLSAYQAAAVALVVTNVDFAFRLSLDYDFGDLPSIYGTRLDDTPLGARHELPSVTNLYLGASIDSEPNGQPTVDASGDSDDEDGVDVEKMWLDGANGGEVIVTVGAGSGWLVGWVDFDDSGDFDTADELVINQSVTTGVYTNLFDVPVGTMSTTSSTPLYARFRLFEAEPLFPEIAYSGEAGNGEVEDYLFTFPNPTLVRLVSFGAYLADGDVIVEWETAFEANTLGFYLERLVPGSGYVRVNNALILADPASPAGTLYRQLDGGAVAGGRYTYRLIEVETDGTQHVLGPFTITVGSVLLSLDEWSRQMFTPAQLADASVSGPDADPDGDGHSNGEEYLAGTFPLDGESVLHISSIDGSDDGTVVRWMSESGRVYSLEISTDGMRTFLPMAAGIEATPPENVFTGGVLRANGPCFYRVRAVRE